MMAPRCFYGARVAVRLREADPVWLAELVALSAGGAFEICIFSTQMCARLHRLRRRCIALPHIRYQAAS